MPHQPPPTPASIAAGLHDPPITIDEEEDTSRGDMLDHLSPREISQARYTQHHEWMEEVLGSVYPISKIRPMDLGLGLRGELEEMTKGLLDPPTFPPTRTPRRPTASKTSGEAGGMEGTEDAEGADDEDDGHMDPTLLEELTRRAEAKTKELEEEMERMKLVHQQRLLKIKKTGVMKDAERKLRANINFTSMFGLVETSAVEEAAPVSGAASTSAEERQQSPPAATMTETEDEILAMVEQHLGKKIVPREMVVRWDLETGNAIVGDADLVQEDKDEIMGNTSGDRNVPAASLVMIDEPPQQENPITNHTPPTSNGNSDNISQTIGGMDDVNMDNDDTLMDEPSNFADAFDARDLEDPDESSTTATPHLVLPPHQSATMGGSPSMGIPSPSQHLGALTPGTLALSVPSPTGATASPVGSSPGSIPAMPVPDVSSTVPSGGVTYTGIPGLGGGDHGGV